MVSCRLRAPSVLAALILAAGALSAAPAAAKRDKAPSNNAESEVERLEIAREHFQKGEELAKAGQYEAALVELQLAEVAHPSAMITEAEQRVRAALDARHAEAASVVVVAPPPSPVPTGLRLRRFVAPIVVAPLALGALVAGGALLGVVRSDVSHLRGTCSPSCNPGDVDPLRAREAAAYGLLATGAVLAAADAVLWGVLARRPRAEVSASAVVDGTGGGVVVRGAF